MKNFLKRRECKYIIGFVGLLLLLLIPTVKPLFVVAFGEEVKIEAIGFDPTDPFKGDFIRIGYVNEIITFDMFDETITTRDEDKLYQLLNNEKLYVSLEKSGEYYHVANVSLEKPEGLFIRAEFEHTNWEWNEELDRGGATGIVVTYNLDKFYVPEGTGYELEQAIQRGEAYSVVKIFNGYAVLTDLRLK